MELRDVLFFDKMLTPKIITVVYWIVLVSVVIGGFTTMFTASFWTGLGILIGGLLGARIWCEIMIVMFKMNEALQAIRTR